MSLTPNIVAAGLVLAALASASAEELKSETREVGAFNAIEMRGAAKMDVAVGPKQSVIIEARPEIVSEITTTLRGEVLVIDWKNHRWWDWHDMGPVRIHITVPKLAWLAIEGTGDVTIGGLNGGASAFTVSGTGDIKASGALEKLTININGTGNADFSGVPVDEAAITINGTGSVSVKPRHVLRAAINGAGSVTYDGTPEQISSSVNGAGSVRRKP